MATRADLPDLLALAAEPPDGPLRVDPQEGIARWRRRRRRRVGAALAAGLLVVLGVAVPVVTSQHQTRQPSTLTATSPPAAPAPAGADLAALVAGHWSTLPAAPIPPRQGAATVWTGTELLIWGGASGPQVDVRHNDGAAYNPATHTWRALPAGPLSARDGQSAAWTGTEMIIWGGYDTISATHFHVTADGAAYDPSANRWHRLPAGPLSPRADALVTWTGSTMIVLGGHPAVQTDTVRGDDDGAAYDPTTDRWQRLPTPTPPNGHPLGWAAAVQKTGQLLAWSEWSQTRSLGPGASSTTAGIDLFGYDEETGHWRPLPSGASSSPEPDQVLATGRLVVVRGRPSYCGSCAGPRIADVTSAYDPATDTWTRLPADPLGGRLNELASTGMALVSLDINATNGSTVPGDASGYDLAARRWARLPTAPYGCVSSASPIWTGRELLAYCAQPDQAAARSSGLAFTPGAPDAAPDVSAQPPGSVNALQLCQAGASASQTVAAAHLTVVRQVRDHRVGPDTSPADKPWANLPDNAPAAWCSFMSASGYVIAAATTGGPVVPFVSSPQLIDPGSQGPEIP